MKTIRICVFLLFFFFLPILTQAEEAFSDLDNYRYESAVRYLYEKKVLQGYADNTFRAENYINRAEFTKILVGAIEPSFLARSDYSLRCFQDVNSNDWYAPYVCFAKKQNLVSGYPDGNFYPAKKINLAEALKMITQAFEIKQGAKGEDWYTAYVKGMGEKKYIPSVFKRPSQNIKRGEMAEILWRVMEKKQNQDFVSAQDLLNAKNECQVLEENIPSNIDMIKIRTQWLAWYNAERAKLGKYPYTYNSQLNRSAVIWSETMKKKGSMDHKRTGQTAYYDYNLITKWFADLGLVFKNIQSRTHTENIGWGYYNCSDSDCTDEVLSGIRTTLDFYLGEKNKASQAHYQSLMNDYFKEIGLGLAFQGNKYYLTVHYGTEIISDPLEICE